MDVFSYWAGVLSMEKVVWGDAGPRAVEEIYRFTKLAADEALP